MKNKTNVIKSFMKAGIFPLNPNAIHRSRLINRSTSNNTSSSNIQTNSDQNHIQSSSDHVDTSNDGNDVTTDHRQVNNTTSSSHPQYSTFTTSRTAIDALDEVLESTVCNDDDDDGDDDSSEDSSDEEYMMNQSTKNCSTKKKSRKREISSDQESPNAKKKGKVQSKNVTFDTSDDEGSLDTCINLL